jgi:hypothetical protein
MVQQTTRCVQQRTTRCVQQTTWHRARKHEQQRIANPRRSLKRLTELVVWRHVRRRTGCGIGLVRQLPTNEACMVDPTKPNLVEILLHSQQLSSCLVGCVVHESQVKHNPRIGGSPQELLAQPNEWLCSASRQPSDVPEPRAPGSAICRWTAACTRQWRRLSRS